MLQVFKNLSAHIFLLDVYTITISIWLGYYIHFNVCKGSCAVIHNKELAFGPQISHKS